MALADFDTLEVYLMGWASRTKHKGPGMEKPAPSKAEKRYTVRYSKEHYERGEGFTDGRGVNYMCRPDGSLMRGGVSVQPDPMKAPEK